MLKQVIHPFKNWGQFIFANIGIALIITLFFNNLDTPIKIALGTLWAFLICITQWLGHSYLQIKIGEKFSWLNQPVKRFLITVVQIVVYSILAYGAVQFLMNYLVLGEIPRELKSFSFDFWSLPVYISLFIALILSAIGFYNAWKNEAIDKEKIKNEMLTYKYEALRNQINPHFMFNSLNVLTDLVYEDQKMAVAFIHKFSDIYRYVLDSREKELVPLEEELTFINKYIFLLKTRFEDKLIIDINLTPNQNEMIVPLALQLLIENAVKHNEVSTKNKLHISIQKEGDQYIVVSNPIQPKNIGDTSKQIGLKNLKQQYSFFTDLQVEVTENNSQFSVKIPVITKA